MKSPFTLTFKRASDQKPEDGDQIWYINNSEFYGSYEILYGTVEYSYHEIDPENGAQTGDQYFLDEGDEIPENCHLVIAVVGDRNTETLSDNTLWIPAEEVDELVQSSSAI